MSEREQRRPGDRFRVTEEGPDQLRQIAQALLQAAREIDRGAVVRDYGGLVMAKGPGGSLRVSGDLRLREVAAGPWDGKEWPGTFEDLEARTAAALAAGTKGVALPGAPCPTCGAKGFDQSILGADRCEFCDGTEGGNPPRPAEDDPEDGA